MYVINESYIGYACMNNTYKLLIPLNAFTASLGSSDTSAVSTLVVLFKELHACSSFSFFSVDKHIKMMVNTSIYLPRNLERFNKIMLNVS